MEVNDGPARAFPVPHPKGPADGGPGSFIMRMIMSCRPHTAVAPHRAGMPRSSSVSTLALSLVAGTASMVLAVALLACAGGLARAAEADPHRRDRASVDRSIPAGEVAGRLSQRGYSVTDPVIRRGSAYLTHATDKFGQRLRLVMDARNGEIIGLRVLGDGRHPRRDAPARP